MRRCASDISSNISELLASTEAEPTSAPHRCELGSARQPGLEVRARSNRRSPTKTLTLSSPQKSSPFRRRPCNSLALHARSVSGTFMRMSAESVAKWSAVRGLYAPPATAQFRRTLRLLVKTSIYPEVVAGHSACPRPLAAFLIVAASLVVLVSGGGIYFHDRRKAESGSRLERDGLAARQAGTEECSAGRTVRQLISTPAARGRAYPDERLYRGACRPSTLNCSRRRRRLGLTSIERERAGKELPDALLAAAQEP